jgi:hypothetical protein
MRALALPIAILGALHLAGCVPEPEPSVQPAPLPIPLSVVCRGADPQWSLTVDGPEVVVSLNPGEERVALLSTSSTEEGALPPERLWRASFVDAPRDLVLLVRRESCRTAEGAAALTARLSLPDRDAIAGCCAPLTG